MPDERGHATITLHVDIDHKAVKTVVEEGIKDLKTLVEHAVSAIEEELEKRDRFELDTTQSYDFKLKVHLLDTALGKVPLQTCTRLDLLMDEVS